MNNENLPKCKTSWEELEKQAHDFGKNHSIEVLMLGAIRKGSANPDYLTRTVYLTINNSPYTILIDNSGLNMAGHTWATTHGIHVAAQHQVSPDVLGEALDVIFRPYHDEMRALL